MLKKIEAIIREDKLNDVKEALREIGIVGLNSLRSAATAARAASPWSGRSGSYQVDMLTKIQLNIILSEHNLEETIETILNSAYTGETGDGLIFVYPVEEVIRIRTRERGHEAVMYPGDIDERKTFVPKT